MPNPKPKKENLKPVRNTAEAKKLGSAGGKKSGQIRREKKIISQIYAELLADVYEANISGKSVKITGDKLVKTIARDVLMRRDSSSVSMLKEIREATEGAKIAVSGKDGAPLSVSFTFVAGTPDAGNTTK